MNGRRSADELERRIRLHLLPRFAGRRLATIRTTDVNTFILKRRADVMVFGEGERRQERKVSNGEINRELTTLKRIFNLARQNGKLTQVPHIPVGVQPDEQESEGQTHHDIHQAVSSGVDEGGLSGSHSTTCAAPPYEISSAPAFPSAWRCR